jgi:hypothetical protein
MIEITETTVGRLGDTRVAVGNIFEQEYIRGDGLRQTGPAAIVYVLNERGEEKLVAGRGTVLTLGSTRWEVILVEAERSNRGRIGFSCERP